MEILDKPIPHFGFGCVKCGKNPIEGERFTFEGENFCYDCMVTEDLLNEGYEKIVISVDESIKNDYREVCLSIVSHQTKNFLRENFKDLPLKKALKTVNNKDVRVYLKNCQFDRKLENSKIEVNENFWPPVIEKIIKHIEEKKTDIQETMKMHKRNIEGMANEDLKEEKLKEGLVDV